MTYMDLTGIETIDVPLLRLYKDIFGGLNPETGQPADRLLQMILASPTPEDRITEASWKTASVRDYMTQFMKRWERQGLFSDIDRDPQYVALPVSEFPPIEYTVSLTTNPIPTKM